MPNNRISFLHFGQVSKDLIVGFGFLAIPVTVPYFRVSIRSAFAMATLDSAIATLVSAMVASISDRI